MGSPGSPRAKSGVSASVQRVLAGGGGAGSAKKEKGTAKGAAAPANQRILTEAEVLQSLDCLWDARESAQSDLPDPSERLRCLSLTLLPYQLQVGVGVIELHKIRLFIVSWTKSGLLTLFTYPWTGLFAKNLSFYGFYSDLSGCGVYAAQRGGGERAAAAVHRAGMGMI
ncbi:hypothetical protein B484DRAFT_49173 [Ochromonadaceae sp. CCMP2298]|nr:hypothetical protein B484DRAFT_49173 [Ochromonadaceae sp. CCMP2298]